MLESISSKYENFIDATNVKIEKLYPEIFKRIKSNYAGDQVEKKLNDFYRYYYVKNQKNIIKEINTIFENYDVKLFIFKKYNRINLIKLLW